VDDGLVVEAAMRKPDRFERMVEMLPMAYEGFPSTVKRTDVITLLRRHHAAVVRVVKQHGLTASCNVELGSYEALRGYKMMGDDILVALDRLKKGTP